MTGGSLQNTVLLACGLFAVGILGVTCRRNVLVMLLSVEILLNAANLVFVAFSKVHKDVTGQVFVFFSMTVAAAEVAVGLAIVIALYRLRRSTDVAGARELKEEDYGPMPRLRLEGEDAHHDGHPAGPAGGGHGTDGHGPAGHAPESVATAAHGTAVGVGGH